MFVFFPFCSRLQVRFEFRAFPSNSVSSGFCFFNLLISQKSYGSPIAGKSDVVIVFILFGLALGACDDGSIKLTVFSFVVVACGFRWVSDYRVGEK